MNIYSQYLILKVQIYKKKLNNEHIFPVSMFYCIVESLTTDNQKITFKNKTCSNNSLQFNCENKQGQRKAWRIPSPKN
jgi:hypothetical protein